MRINLRTRLFLIVAVLLGASIAVSALLSRRATLVEVRAVVNRGPLTLDAAPILDRAAAIVEQVSPEGLAPALAEIEEDASRRIVVADGARIVAASNPALAQAKVEQLTGDGTFIALLDSASGRSAIHVRGAPVRRVTTTDGRALTVLVLPSLDDEDARGYIGPFAGGPYTAGAPLWVWTTVATGLMAVPLVFAVARRILNPIAALTCAAQRMQQGELDVRVEVRGGDELAELGRAFNAMASRLEETERLRQHMVGDIAHELRSPVTHLRCTLESIQDGLARADRSSIDSLHEETLFLQRLIGDLQDLALAEAGQLALRREPVDVREVVRRAVIATPGTPMAATYVDVPESLPRIQGDSDRLEQVLRNLLSNARMQTPAEGRIDVRVREEERLIRIEVADTGRGIEPSHLAHVFERFYRADQSRSRETGGAGLGLAIVRQLVMAHGGSVTVQSEGAGRGAVFVVLLPIA